VLWPLAPAYYVLRHCFAAFGVKLAFKPPGSGTRSRPIRAPSAAARSGAAEKVRCLRPIRHRKGKVNRPHLPTFRVAPPLVSRFPRATPFPFSALVYHFFVTRHKELQTYC
jgi:hypothetical protein